MVWLILGILLWAGAHFFRRLAPTWRADMQARMGNTAKGVLAAVLVVAVVLMVIGYRAAPAVNLWFPPLWTVHVTDLAMLVAIGLLGLGHSKSRLRPTLRHPMLLAVLVWALAHLLANGDLASLVLFGGLGLWSLAEMMLLDARARAPAPFEGGSLAGDVRLAVITVVLYAAIAAVHTWLGVSPFGG